MLLAEREVLFMEEFMDLFIIDGSRRMGIYRICITLCGRVVVLDLFFKLGYSWRDDSFGAWYFNIVLDIHQLDIAHE